MNVFVKLTKPILEDEGVHVFFEYRGSEYHPLDELISETDKINGKKQIV